MDKRSARKDGRFRRNIRGTNGPAAGGRSVRSPAEDNTQFASEVEKESSDDGPQPNSDSSLPLSTDSSGQPRPGTGAPLSPVPDSHPAGSTHAGPCHPPRSSKARGSQSGLKRAQDLAFLAEEQSLLALRDVENEVQAALEDDKLRRSVLKQTRRSQRVVLPALPCSPRSQLAKAGYLIRVPKAEDELRGNDACTAESNNGPRKTSMKKKRLPSSSSSSSSPSSNRRGALGTQKPASSMRTEGSPPSLVSESVTDASRGSDVSDAKADFLAKLKAQDFATLTIPLYLPVLIQEEENTVVFDMDDHADNVDMEVSMQRCLIAQKDCMEMQAAHIERLDEIMKGLRESCSSSYQAQTNEDLRAQATGYMDKAMAMEEFLNNYGLAWVGTAGMDADGSSESEPDSMPTIFNDPRVSTFLPAAKVGMWNHADSLVDPEEPADYKVDSLVDPQEPADYTVDFSSVFFTLQSINAMHGTEAHIEYTKTGATFKVPGGVRLTLYKNGMVWRDGPFRPYSDPATLTCIQDLDAGYFPRELACEFPEGCPIITTDRHDTFFCAKKPEAAVFHGKGRALGHALSDSSLSLPATPLRLSPRPELKPAAQDRATGPPPGGYTSSETFLSRLPVCVVRKGKLLTIRDDIGKILKGDSEEPPTLRTINSPEDLSPGQELTRLKVQTEDGKEILILHMLPSATVGDLRNMINVNRKPLAEGAGYRIVASVSRLRLRDNKATLAEAGLVPSAKLYLSRCKDHQAF